MSNQDPTSTDLKAAVRAKYSAVGTENACCGGPRVGDSGAAFDVSDEYSADISVSDDADLNLGCGLPSEIADLRPGEHVLDLGSGAGMDAFVARREVGRDGHIHGVDLAEAMVEKARLNAAELGYENVTFEQGDIEALPVEDETVDVVLSNCALNLVPDKGAAFSEAYRVLRPGGRFVISDLVSVGPLPAPVREAAELHAGCVAGSMERAAYLDLIRSTGFGDVRIATEENVDLPDALLAMHLNAEEQSRVCKQDAGLRSVTVVGNRPDDLIIAAPSAVAASS